MATASKQTELLNNLSVRIAGYRIEVNDSVECPGHGDSMSRTAKFSVYKRRCKLFTGTIEDYGWGGPISVSYDNDVYPLAEIKNIVAKLDDEAKTHVWRYFPPRPVAGMTVFTNELSFEDILDFASSMCAKRVDGWIDDRFAGRIVDMPRFARMVEEA